MVFVSVLYAAIIFALNELFLRSYLGLRPDAAKVYWKPIFSALVMGAVTYIVYRGVFALASRVLAEYFATVPHKKTKTQESYKLPGGKLVLKTQNPEYKKDEATVIEWLKKNDMAKYVKVEEKLDWAGLKEVTGVFEGHIVTEDGEIVPGIDVVDREAKFVVEV
jgi:hypothetical protein